MNDYQLTGPVFYWPETDEIVIYTRPYAATIYAFVSSSSLSCYRHSETSEYLLFEHPEDFKEHGWIKLGKL